MTHGTSGTLRGIAPLANLALADRAISRALERAEHLPGMVEFHGPSGWGKSIAAAYVGNRHRAYYVQAKSVWTKKAFLLAILKEMGIKAAGTLSEMLDQVAEQLAASRRPLIIDEMDHIVDKNAVELVRDIYESSFGAILLIGEEGLPHKLKKFERFHGRILDWVAAAPVSLDDSRELAKLYCPHVQVADDLLDMLVDMAHGSVRRVCVNLERIQEEALSDGRDAIDKAAWGSRELYRGEAPKARRV